MAFLHCIINIMRQSSFRELIKDCSSSIQTAGRAYNDNWCHRCRNYTYNYRSITL